MTAARSESLVIPQIHSNLGIWVIPATFVLISSPGVVRVSEAVEKGSPLADDRQRGRGVGSRRRRLPHRPLTYWHQGMILRDGSLAGAGAMRTFRSFIAILLGSIALAIVSPLHGAKPRAPAAVEYHSFQ